MKNPQNTQPNPQTNHTNPRNPTPPRNHTIRIQTHEKRSNLEGEKGPKNPSHNGVVPVEVGRQPLVDGGRRAGIQPPVPGQAPRVLARRRGLGQCEDADDRGGAVAERVAARGEHVERGEVVGDEEDVAGDEEEVVEEVDGEVGDAVVEDCALQDGVRRREAGF